MNSRVPSMKQMVVQKRHTFAAGLKNERESRRIIFLLNDMNVFAFNGVIN